MVELILTSEEALKQANVVDETITAVIFCNIRFDADVLVRAAIDLFHQYFQNGRQLKCLTIISCRGPMDQILHAASSLELFDEIRLVRCYDLSLHGFWSLSWAMKFNKRLTKLYLNGIVITRQQAAALGAGLVTFNSQHFKELYLDRVEFDDGAISELASGLKQNSSLCRFTASYCRLGDAELANDRDLGDAELVELVDAVVSHPSLTKLDLEGNKGQKLTLAALGKLLASSTSCRIEELNLTHHTIFGDYHGFSGHLGILAQGLQWNESLTELNLSYNGFVDKDIECLTKRLASCKLRTLNLRGNRITHGGFVSLTQNIPKSLEMLNISKNTFRKEEVAGHTLTLLKEHPQLWFDGFEWRHPTSPAVHEKIQHFKDLNRCGRILLAPEGAAIPLSVWPIVLARATTLLRRTRMYSKERRTSNVIFHLLQGPALMQRRFDRDSSQAACVGVGEPTTISLKPPAASNDKPSLGS
jgi:hypothetical protein